VEVTVQSLSDVLRAAEITATPEDLAPHFNKAYLEYRKKIEIRGFRKGKAPIDIVKKLYGDLIENDSLNEIATEFYRQAVKEKELKPIGEPVLVDMDYKHGESFRCKIQFDVRPHIKIKGYKGIEVEKVVHTTTDDEVEKELVRLQRANASMEEAEAVASPEYIVTATLQDLDETGALIIGKKSENVRFYLADEQLEQPFKDALKDAKKNGEYLVQFEHKHDEHTHTVNTQIIVKKIEKVTLPVLDDAFVAKVTKSKFTTVETLCSNIKEEIIAYWKEKSERQVINSLTAEIIRRHEFQVPESLIRNVLDGLLEEVKNEYPDKRLPSEFDSDKFKEENRAYAIYQAKWALLREELIKAENVAASDEDLEKLAEEESEKIKIPKDRLINYYKSSEQIKDRLIGDKLLKLLVNSAKVKEVPEKV
jgi:trigger factor